MNVIISYCTGQYFDHFHLNVLYKLNVRGRSQLSTFMKAYTAYARGEGVWDHRTLLSPKINI